MLKNRIITGDALTELKKLPAESVDCVMTSPPYWALRDYGVDGQLGLEPTFEQYINDLCDIFDEVKRVLKKSGACWVNLGDTYGGTGDKGICTDPKYERGRNGQSKALNRKYTSKCLLQIPSRFAIEMADRGWILRNEIIWHKPNGMPSSANDRFTVDFEKLFFFTKSKKYYFKQQLEDSKNSDELDYRQSLRRKNAENYKMKVPYKGNFPKSFRKDGKRNKRTVWSIPTKPCTDAHFAVYPEELCITPIKATCPKGGITLDPFFGRGTTGLAVKSIGERYYLGIELNPKNAKMAEKNLKQQQLF